MLWQGVLGEREVKGVLWCGQMHRFMGSGWGGVGLFQRNPKYLDVALPWRILSWSVLHGDVNKTPVGKNAPLFILLSYHFFCKPGSSQYHSYKAATVMRRASKAAQRPAVEGRQVNVLVTAP